MMLSNKIRHLKNDIEKALLNISNITELTEQVNNLQSEVNSLKENLAQKNELLDSINKRAGYLEKINLIMSNDIVSLSNALNEICSTVELYIIDEYAYDSDKKKNDYH